MDVVRACMICGKPAQSTCSVCGRLVCQDHYYPQAKMCSQCIPVTERRHGGHGRGDAPGLMR